MDGNGGVRQAEFAIAGYREAARFPQHTNSAGERERNALSLFSRSVVHARAKRAIDVCGAVTLAVCLFPFIATVVCLLKMDGGQVVFAHQRVGRDGRRFKVFKFRSMVPDAERVLERLIATTPELRDEWERDHKLKDDPRITAVGRFLRKTSLDELPQLINVLKGEMSLVGPRPIVDAEMAKYGRAIRHYLSVKPGLTGLWQVSGRNDTDYFRRVAMDRYYAARASVGLDLVILVRTVMVVLGRQGAY